MSQMMSMVYDFTKTNSWNLIGWFHFNYVLSQSLALQDCASIPVFSTADF